MKIGIIFAVYNCEEHVDDCLRPWINLRESHNLILTATSGRFKPYQDIGIPDKNEGTLKKLANKKLDFLISTAGENLLDEDTSRNTCLDYLKSHECDIVWIVDGDELYTESQIKGIIDYIERNPDVLSFSIYLKNYSIRLPYFEPPWARPSIARVNSPYGRINRYYFDSNFDYEDGIHGINSVETRKVPKNIAFVEHHSWTNKDYTHDKIRYQEVRYDKWYDNDGNLTIWPREARCSKKSINGEIYFNTEYYSIRKEIIPSLHEYPTDTILSPTIIAYNRLENNIHLRTDYHLEGYTMFVKSLDSSKEYGRFIISIPPTDAASFWYHPVISQEELESPDFHGYRIEIFKDDNIVHIENILTRIGIE
jgi:hypothetical protein